ncbi:hypothetical protein ENBRE01_0860 [Enteropsectra breve]|nr:hypothetical protein ENBRE01_0860 [Enteropsectra breve]
MSPSLLDSMEYLRRRKFYGPELLPLPTHLLYPFKHINSKIAGLMRNAWRKNIIAKFININPSLGIEGSLNILPIKLVALATILCSLIICTRHPLKRAVPSLIVFIAPFLGTLNRRGNDVFVALFSCFFIKTISDGHFWMGTLFYSLTVSCDLYCMVLWPAFFYIRMKSLFYFSADLKNGAWSMCKEAMKTFLQLLLVPNALLIMSIAIDLNVRNRHSTNGASMYSLNFNTNLEKFSKSKSFGADETKNNRFLMDRSVVSLFNIKHKKFVIDEEENRYFEIQKVHDKDFSDEEPRFIKNGDTIKFNIEGTERYLGLKIENKDDKFNTAAFKAWEDEDATWRVECEGYLQADSTTVRFVHGPTGLFMGSRKIKASGDKAGVLEMHGSVYGEKSSRDYLILENENHPYFIENFMDERCREKSSGFKKMSRLEMLIEHLKMIGKYSNEGAISCFKDAHEDAFIFAFTSVYRKWTFAGTLFLTVILLVHSFKIHIFKQWGKLDEDDDPLHNILTIVVISNLLCTAVFGMNYAFILYSCALYNLYKFSQGNVSNSESKSK